MNLVSFNSPLLTNAKSEMFVLTYCEWLYSLHHIASFHLIMFRNCFITVVVKTILGERQEHTLDGTPEL